MLPSLQGPIAALLTPRDRDGRINSQSFSENLELVLSRGVGGVCVGGATGEYALATLEERCELFAVAREVMGKRGQLIAGIGAGKLSECVDLGKKALAVGAEFLLLPPPHFFRYAEQDVHEFYVQAAEQIQGPILIYNVPAFTSPVGCSLVLNLIESVPEIVGIKDSSGSLETLDVLSRRKDLNAWRVLGNDSVAGEALDRKLCHTAISGIAGVLPELTVALFCEGEVKRKWILQRLAELISRADRFPAPWGLKLIAACRGIHKANWLVPLSLARRQECHEFEEWFHQWWPSYERPLLVMSSPGETVTSKTQFSI
jgi:4-hydroxy-tetrahydrodipicolinate synthase